jgi:hypothetical protein
MTRRGITERRPQATNGAGDSFIDNPDICRLYDYWRARRNGRPMPAKRDLDPLDIGWALSRIFLVDYAPADGFVYRLAGSEIAGVFGRGNLKGLRPRDFLPPARAAIVEALFRRAVEERCVLWMRGMIYLRADRTPLGERLILPLCDGGHEDPVTGVLGMTVVERDAPAGLAAVEEAAEIFVPVDGLA